mmetsp:Transcript_42043/g.113372  ORF Transcript_42043/g.113372 Transcript_42043/m.113372 type:complete len:333 (+) Transcript_42043:1016-2014(+)
MLKDAGPCAQRSSRMSKTRAPLHSSSTSTFASPLQPLMLAILSPVLTRRPGLQVEFHFASRPPSAIDRTMSSVPPSVGSARRPSGALPCRCRTTENSAEPASLGAARELADGVAGSPAGTQAAGAAAESLMGEELACEPPVEGAPTAGLPSLGASTTERTSSTSREAPTIEGVSLAQVSAVGEPITLASAAPLASGTRAAALTVGSEASLTGLEPTVDPAQLHRSFTTAAASWALRGPAPEAAASCLSQTTPKSGLLSKSQPLLSASRRYSMPSAPLYSWDTSTIALWATVSPTQSPFTSGTARMRTPPSQQQRQTWQRRSLISMTCILLHS